MLMKEHLDLVFIHSAHLLGRNGDFISVLVAASFGDGVHVVNGGTSMVDYTKILVQVVVIDSFSGVMILALVTLVGFQY